MADNVNPYVGAARAALGQGLGMGWGDEAEAWLRSKLGQGTYEENLAKIRGEYGAYSKEYPFTSGALEFTGGAAPGVAAMFIPGGQAAGAAQLQRSTLGALGRLAGMGAATGAVAGAGSAEEGGRLSGAGTGALIGGATGVAAPVVLRGGKGVYEWGKERLFPTAATVEQRALEKLSRAAGEARLTPQQIERAMATDRAMGVPSVVANVNPALAELAEAVAQRTGPGARTIEETLTRQKRGARERAYQQTAAGLKPGDFYADEERLVQTLRNKANTQYRDAYAVGEVSDPKIMRILEAPEVKNAYETARKIADAQASLAKIRGEDPAQYALRDIYEFVTDASGKVVGLKTSQVPDVRTLDYMKRALDAQIRAGYKSSDSATLANTATLKEIRNELRDTLKTTIPEYDKALKNYAGDMEVIDAMRRGYDDFGKMDHEQVIKLVAGMTPSEKEAFRTGVARDIYSRVMGPTGNINAANRIIGSPEMEAKLQPLFDSPAAFDLFKSALTREAQMFEQANRILGGSQTAKRTQMRGALEEQPAIGEAVERAITGGFWSSLTGLASRAVQSGQMTEKVAENLASKLMSKDPNDVAAVVKALEAYGQRAAPRAVRASATEAGATTGTAASVFPAPGSPSAAPEIDDAPAEAPGITGPDIEADIAAEEAKRKKR